ncbi:MAG TPA: hypothetical protein VL422_03175 [Miltoncostaea sp.]|jgi:peptidoglycan/LPS O-acetylase OafA/YrhL|nr:hypothetical protein [Miltoncostaea sp.]
MAPLSYGGALRTTLQATAAAYGYTLTTATTVAVLVATHGPPGTGEVALFALGGLVAFALLEAAVFALDPDDDPSPRQRLAFAGALNVAAVAVALGAATGLAHAMPGTTAWFLTPLAATALYMLGVAAQLRLLGRVPVRRRP